MKLSSQIPDIYPRLHDKFGVEWDRGLIIAHKGVIHSKGMFLPEQKYVHEEVHIQQQEKMGVDKWWDKYIDDPEFRKLQEAEAYREEMKYVEKNIKDRNLKYRIKHDIAVTFASEIYGGIITYSEALKLIQNK